MTLGHWHGYLWTGSSKDLKDESLRRPGAPGTPQAQEFLRSSLPPMRIGHYLLRRNAVSADLTWADVDDAVDWMAVTYKSHPPMEGDVGFPAANGAPPLADDVGLDARRTTSRDGLINGVDAYWQYYTTRTAESSPVRPSAAHTPTCPTSRARSHTDLDHCHPAEETVSLRMLFDQASHQSMMTTWPTKPVVHNLPDSSHLPAIVNAKLLNTYLDTGCAPADEINVVKDGAARHPRAYATAGKLDPARIAMWRERGYSFQIRNLDRWYPPLHAMCRAIQHETGFGCYVTAFVTPAGAQGLDYHWDQNIGVIYQASGTKTWQIWRPVVEEPHRGYKASNTQPLGELVEQLKADGPDLVIELKPRQVLVLPRGWVHNPHALNQTEESIHLTFVIRERTGFWVSERLAKAAIESTPLRRVIAPADIVSEAALAIQIDQVRSALVDWLSKVDTQSFATELLDTARSELEPDYA